MREHFISMDKHFGKVIFLPTHNEGGIKRLIDQLSNSEVIEIADMSIPI